MSRAKPVQLPLLSRKRQTRRFRPTFVHWCAAGRFLFTRETTIFPVTRKTMKVAGRHWTSEVSPLSVAAWIIAKLTASLLGRARTRTSMISYREIIYNRGEHVSAIKARCEPTVHPIAFFFSRLYSRLYFVLRSRANQRTSERKRARARVINHACPISEVLSLLRHLAKPDNRPALRASPLRERWTMTTTTRRRADILINRDARDAAIFRVWIYWIVAHAIRYRTAGRKRERHR